MMINRQTALERLAATNLDESQRKRIAARIERSFANDTEEEP